MVIQQRNKFSRYSYVQEGLADIRKKNVLENLETGTLEYGMIGEFLADLKKESGEGDNKIIKMVELERVKQKSKTIEKFVQEFIRATKDSKYEKMSELQTVDSILFFILFLLLISFPFFLTQSQGFSIISQP